jgi:hypothetical protein
MAQPLGTNDPNRTSQPDTTPSRKWWLIELWEESRGLFKAVIEHFFFCFMLISAIVFFDWYIGATGLDDEKKRVLKRIDFYAMVLGVVLFSVGFVIKIVVYMFRRRESNAESR